MPNSIKSFALRQTAHAVYGVRKVQDVFWKIVADGVVLTLSEEQAAAWTRLHYKTRTGQYIRNEYNQSGLHAWEAVVFEKFFQIHQPGFL